MMLEQSQEQELIDHLESNPWDIEVHPPLSPFALALPSPHAGADIGVRVRFGRGRARRRLRRSSGKGRSRRAMRTRSSTTSVPSPLRFALRCFALSVVS